MQRAARTDILSEMLAPHLGWFEGHCRSTAARAGGEWEELFQSGVLYLLSQLQRGVLDRVEPTGWRAFTASTLVLGARQRLSAERRARRRRGEEAEGEAVASPEEDALAQLLRRGDALAVHAAIARLSSPVRRFVLLAVYAPEALERRHLQEAAAYRRGGARLFCRPVGEAWRLLSSGRARLSGAEWKAHLARVVAFKKAPRAVTAKELSRVLWAIDQHLSRGRDELVALAEVHP